MSLHSQAIRWEKVYVFISSTFGDMHAERDYLVKRVFPALQDWCERRRLRLVDIDLRWGVTEADTTSKRAVEVCLERINDCRPFFLCFLGQRHGWVPKETDVADDTFEKFPALREALGAASVTELEIRHAILRPFTSPEHKDDKHAAPQPAEHAFFYVREAGYLQQLHNAPRQLLCTFTDDIGPDEETDDERQQRERARAALHTLREATIPQDRRVLYQADWHAELATPELAMPLECTGEWRTKWNRFAQLDLAATDERIPADKLAAANEYNVALTRGRLSQFRSLAAAREQFDPGTELAQIIQHDLQQAIQTRFPTHTEVVQQTEQQKELDQQEGFLQACSEGFIERTGDFAQLDGYVADDSNKLCVLTAAGGMGKSTLLAKWIDRVRTQPEPQPALHFRFIGASDRSTTVYSLLRSLLGEMLAAKSLDQKLPDDPNKLREALPELLAAIGEHGKTVIVLDALNQLESGLQDLHWLPRTLPANIKLIVSFKRDDDTSEQVYQQFQAAQATLIEVPPFAALEDRRKLVRAYLQQYLKELDEAHLATLIATDGASNPLYLKVVLSELRVFGAHARLAEKIRRDFGDTPITAFQGVLQRLASDPAYAPIPSQQAVPLLFGLLAHARHGLSVEELTSLFVQALQLEDNEQWQQAAADTINLLLRQVRPFLARREGRYDYFYESFQLAAQQHCAISEAEPSATGWSAPQFHQLLAGLFSRQADPSGKRQWDGNSPRALRDLPYHLLEGKLNEELFQIARNEVFLTAQKRSFPDVPELYLQTIQAAIEGAARIDDAARMAEFVLAHARQVVEAGQESPLDALRSGQLARAWKLADLCDPERCVLWYLLLVWELNETNRSGEAHATLERAAQKHLPRLSGWQSECAIHFLYSVFNINKEKALELASHLLDDSYSRAFLTGSGCYIEAPQIAQQISNEEFRTKALGEIARAQAQADQQKAAGQTFTQALQTVQQISNKRTSAQSLQKMVEVQARQFARVLQTAQKMLMGSPWLLALRGVVDAHAQAQHFAQALQTAQQISDERRKAEALKDISVAQTQAGQFTQALRTAQKMPRGSPWLLALREIAKAQAQAGHLEQALQTAQQIQVLFEFEGNELLSQIAVEQVQAGHYLQALQVTQQFSDEGWKAKELRRIAVAQAHATHFAQALQTAQQVSKVEWKAEALSAIAVAQAQAGQHEAAGQTFAQAFQTAQQDSKEEWKAEALGWIAVAQAQVHHFAQALQTVQQLSDEKDKAKALSAIAVAQAQAGQQEAAAQTFAQALQAVQQIRNERLKSEALIKVRIEQAGGLSWEQFGRNYTQISDEEGVLRMVAVAQAQTGQFAQALQTVQQISHEKRKTKALSEISGVQAQAGQLAQALEAAQQISDEWWKAEALSAIAVAQAQAGQQEAAGQTLARALETAQRITKEEQKAGALREIAVAQAQAGQQGAASQTFAQALETAQQFSDEIDKAKALSAIAVAQAQAGQFAQALEAAQQISDEERKAEALTVRLLASGFSYEMLKAETLRRIAVAQAQAGQQEAAGQTFAQALQTVQQVRTEAGVLEWIVRTLAWATHFVRALETAQQISDERDKATVLSEIAVVQAQVGQQEAAGQTFAQALQTAQLIRDERYRTEILGKTALMQAQTGFAEQSLLAAQIILTNRSTHLTTIAGAFAKTGNREHFKRLLTPCAYYLDAAYNMCGLLARVYPAQASAIAQIVMRESPREGGHGADSHSSSKPECEIQANLESQAALSRWKSLPRWKQLIIKKPKPPTKI